MLITPEKPGTKGRLSRPVPFRIPICTLLILVIALAAPVSGAVHTLNPGDSIQENITAANPGDTIILNPGTYTQNNILISQNITIRANAAAGGTAANTILDGTGAGGIFATSAGVDFSIDNLTLRNGRAVNGGAIDSSAGHSLAITSSGFVNCTATNNGGAIYTGSGVTVTITSSTFTDCSSANNGGAIETLFTSPLTITSSTFINCQATAGSGGAVRAYGSTAIVSSTFAGCSANNGGAIFVSAETLTITGSTFSSCSSTGGAGAVFVSSGVTLSIASSTFSNCSTVTYGGAIYSSSTVGISSSTFSSCSANDGGAIYASSGSLTITSTRFTGCSATHYGGAIYSVSSSATIITSSSFSSCTATTAGGAIYNEGDMTIEFSRFHQNTAGLLGPAVYRGNGVLNAANNWWGTNDDPSGHTSSTATTNPWLVLNITATPSSIDTIQTSAVRINLTKNSAGTDTAGGGIFVPEGIPVVFAVTSGTGTLAPQSGTITSGANTTTFTPAGAGTSTVAATVDGQTVSADITVTTIPGPATMIGVFRPSTHLFYEDYNGNGVWNGAVIDRSYNFGITGDIPVTGDWNHDGITDIGVFRPSTHLFYLDSNGNGIWNGAVTDRSYNFGITGDIPITGDWNNDGITDIGVFRPSTHLFYLDYNGNGVWNGAVTDRSRNFGITGDIPITGDWNNDGITDIGVFRPSTHLFYLDYNGNGVWNGAVTDRSRSFGITGDLPITGDWNNDWITDIGIFRPSTHLFYLDYNGNGVWNGAVTDRSYNFGITGDTPVSGRWSSSG